MNDTPFALINSNLSFVPRDLPEIARKGLNLPKTADVRVEEVTRFANLNYVFRVTVDGEPTYLKTVADMPKLLRIPLPKERIFFEAEAILRFGSLCGPTVAVPAVLYLDRQAYALGLSDVGRDRRVLLDVIDADYSLLVAQALPLGTALGQVHARSRGCAPFRPAQFEHMLQSVMIDHLLAPGANAVFGELWPSVAAQLYAHRECLVHGDLWGKNLLVGEGLIPGIVDFEGSHVGDPALDVATLLTVALLPILEQPTLRGSCSEFCEALIDAYQTAARANLPAGEGSWPVNVCTRAYLYVGTLLAARGFGPFAYPLSDRARSRVAHLARSINLSPPLGLRDYCKRVLEIGAATDRAR